MIVLCGQVRIQAVCQTVWNNATQNRTIQEICHLIEQQNKDASTNSASQSEADKQPSVHMLNWDEGRRLTIQMLNYANIKRFIVDLAFQADESTTLVKATVAFDLRYGLVSRLIYQLLLRQRLYSSFKSNLAEIKYRVEKHIPEPIPLPIDIHLSLSEVEMCSPDRDMLASTLR